jgi:hypothetical protein
MTFTISQSDTYTQAVSVLIPGAKTKNVFDVEFKRLSQSEIDSMLSRIREGELSDAEFCHEVMVGWKGVADESGELVFSVSNLNALLDVFPVARAIVETYFGGITGAKQKN